MVSKFDYELNPKFCSHCGLKIEWRKNIDRAKFCDLKCNAAAKTANSTRNRCSLCSRICKRDICTPCDRSVKLVRWLAGEYSPPTHSTIRHWFEINVTNCEQCGWHDIHPITGKCPLELDHIDGDHTNNLKSNLRFICARCHSMTPTYRALNKGRGRVERTNRLRRVNG